MNIGALDADAGAVEGRADDPRPLSVVGDETAPRGASSVFAVETSAFFPSTRVGKPPGAGFAVGVVLGGELLRAPGMPTVATSPRCSARAVTSARTRFDAKGAKAAIISPADANRSRHAPSRGARPIAASSSGVASGNTSLEHGDRRGHDLPRGWRRRS